jgi:hypothetical protein
MKKHILTLILFSAVFSFNLKAQFIDYERDNGWKFGINMGGTWQESEQFGSTNFKTKPYAGFSGGLTFGKSIFERPGSFLAFDLRYRFLMGKSYGWLGVPSFDTTITGTGPDAIPFGFQNYRFGYRENTLEGVLTLHSLRERTGILLYGFGGIGITRYTVNADYKDGLGAFNDYSGIDTNSFNQNHLAIATTLRNSSDLDFETELTASKIKFMPSLGVGLGYQFTPSFAMGIEHKITYALNDNEIDGGVLNGKNDRYHYTALIFRWGLLRARPSYNVNSNDNVNDYTTNPTPTPVDNTPLPTGNKPLVNIYNPSTNNSVAHSANYVIKAKVYYVANSSNIVFRQNGSQSFSFTYNPSTNEFTANVILANGSNSFEIIGSNNYGSDQDSKVVIFESLDFTPAGSPPVVKIINPPYSPFNVVSGTQTFPLSAQLLNVTNSNNVKLKVNGSFVTGFSFNPNTNSFSHNLNLIQGNNVVEIIATNNFGQASDVATIIYTRQETTPPPIVTILTPSTSPLNTSNPVEIINGTVMNVASANNINVNINGSSISNFNYDYNTKKISFSANLIVGANVITITGSNAAGVDSKTTTLLFKPSEVVALPIVDFTFPLTSPFSSPNMNITIKGTVLNVNSKNDITVTGNGLLINNFSYNNVTKEVVFNVNLISGSNIFKIKGTNGAGSDEDETVIVHKGTVMLPPVVTITNPLLNPFPTNSPVHTIVAKIVNIDGQNNAGFIFNGVNSTAFTYNASTKEFIATVNLLEGNNTFQISGTNAMGTDSKTGVIKYTKTNEIQPPLVIISNPAVNPFETFNATENVNATVHNVASSANIAVQVNGMAVTNFTFDNTTKKLSFTSNLNLGANVVQISGSNSAGVDTKMTTIIRKQVLETPLPVVQFTVPATNPHTVTTNTLTLKGTVLNIAGQSNIAVNGNGVGINNFTYNASTKEVVFSANLINGSNLFTITGTNTAGTAQAQTVVIYNFVEPVQPPMVNITKPSSNPFNTTNETEIIIADVFHVNSISGVSANFNGTALNNFAFDPATHKFSYTATLLPGGNTLTITGTNSAGVASKTQTIIYNPIVPCIAPTITLTQPQGVAQNSQVGSVSISTDNNKGAIMGTITNAKSLIFKINGQPSNGYSYNPITGAFESFLNLMSGANTYQIIATNECGTTTMNSTFIYTPEVICNEPVITFITPGASPINLIGPATTTFSANVLNLQNADQVSVRLNNNYIAASFDVNTGIVTGNVNLVAGVNTIKITAKNECGTVDKETTINYTQPVALPVVTITNPTSFPHSTTNNAVQVTAKITNVLKTGITVTLDGQVINTWQYNLANQEVNISLNLTVGSHNLTVKGTNAGGQDSKSAEIIVNAIVPTVEFLNIAPTTSSSSPHLPNATQFTVLGRVLNYQGSTITFEKNGAASSDFVYNSTNGEFSIPLQQVVPTSTTPVSQLFSVRIKATNGSVQDAKIGYVKFPDVTPTEPNTTGTGNTNSTLCMPTILVTFNYLHSTVQVKSNKELSNVVLKFSDNTTQKFDNLTGNLGVFQGTGASLNKCLIGVYVKSGCNSSPDGPGYGEWKPNTAYNGSCEMQNSAPVPTNPTENNGQKLQDDEYNHNIQKGDMYFNARNYTTAKTFYIKASAIKPSESYPKNRIAECDKLLTPAPVKPTPTNPVVKPNPTTPTTPTTPTKPTTPVKTTPTKPVNNTGGGKTTEEKKTDTTTPVTTPTVTPTVTPTIKTKGGG